jgi:hypothetical protein
MLLPDFSILGPPIKRRKRHRRKHFQNQEPCLMRGVYFKNMKWQAAIKVDKKQIHLGTVGSQEEAARLYDRSYSEFNFVNINSVICSKPINNKVTLRLCGTSKIFCHKMNKIT